MNTKDIKNFGQLKEAGYRYTSIKEELRRNLLQKLMKKKQFLKAFMGMSLP